MMSRTTSKTMTFFRPFKLTGMESEQPAGRYAVDTDEELLEGVSFPVYRRIATYLTLPRRANGVTSSEMIRVDPEELRTTVIAGLETALGTAANPAGREPTLTDLLAGSTLPQAIASSGLTLGEFKEQISDLKDRWESRTIVDWTLPSRQAASRKPD